MSVPLDFCSSSENASRDLAWAVRARFEAPWPLSVSSGVAAEPLDLKWLAIAMNFLSSAAPTGLKTWAIGLRALAKATVSLWMMDSPIGSAAAFLKMNAVRIMSSSASGGALAGVRT